MILIDYAYYHNTYNGTIPENSFNQKAIEASSKVNYYTYNRINNDNINDNIRNATCEVADLLYNQEQLKAKMTSSSSENGDIASESLGPRSVTYVNKTSIQASQIMSDEEIDKAAYRICYRYLVTTGLMDRCIYE